MEIKTLSVMPYGTNCYILCDETEKRCAIVDPGGEAKKIAATVEKAGCTPCAIFLTHAHYDHTSAVEALTEKWPGLPVYLNERETPPEGDRRAAQLFPPVPGTISYDEGDTIQVGSLTVTVMATPGHSAGSVTLRCENALFCGDTLFARSMGRTDLHGGSEKDIMASLRRLAALEGNLQVLPGHMGASTLDQERKTNPYLRMALAQG